MENVKHDIRQKCGVPESETGNEAAAWQARNKMVQDAGCSADRIGNSQCQWGGRVIGKPVIARGNRSVVNKSIVMPERLMSDDGRVFHIRKWQPTVSTNEAVVIAAEFLVSVNEDQHDANNTTDIRQETT